MSWVSLPRGTVLATGAYGLLSSNLVHSLFLAWCAPQILEGGTQRLTSTKLGQVGMCAGMVVRTATYYGQTEIEDEGYASLHDGAPLSSPPPSDVIGHLMSFHQGSTTSHALWAD